MSGPMRRASRSPTPKWKLSTSAATRSILNGTTPSTRVRKHCSSYFCGSPKIVLLCERLKWGCYDASARLFQLQPGALWGDCRVGGALFPDGRGDDRLYAAGGRSAELRAP